MSSCCSVLSKAEDVMKEGEGTQGWPECAVVLVVSMCSVNALSMKICVCVCVCV